MRPRLRGQLGTGEVGAVLWWGPRAAPILFQLTIYANKRLVRFATPWHNDLVKPGRLRHVASPTLGVKGTDPSRSASPKTSVVGTPALGVGRFVVFLFFAVCLRLILFFLVFFLDFFAFRFLAMWVSSNSLRGSGYREQKKALSSASPIHFKISDPARLAALSLTTHLQSLWQSGEGRVPIVVQNRLHPSKL